MANSDYDKASRFLLLESEGPMALYLMGLTPAEARFVSFHNTVLAQPGRPERIIDAVGLLADETRNGFPVAALFEFQTEPDFNMFGRMLQAGGMLLQQVRPSEHPGDRYDLAAVVVNLTGDPSSGRRMVVGRSEWSLTPIEVNLAALDAAAVLEEIAAGKTPMEVLAWVPLMQRGGEDDIIRRWLEIARGEPNLKRRGNYALARRFARRVGRQETWEQALEGLTVVESSFVLELQAEAKADSLLFVLKNKFGSVPDEVSSPIRASRDGGRIDAWIAKAAIAPTLDEFRKESGL